MAHVLPSLMRQVGASQAVLSFYLVGVPAVMLVERLECQAVIPSLHRTTVLVGVDLGGFELLDGEVVGPCGNHPEPPQSRRSVSADLDPIRNVEAVSAHHRP